MLKSQRLSPLSSNSYFSRAVLRAVSQLTERLEQGNLELSHLYADETSICVIGNFVNHHESEAELHLNRAGFNR